METKKKTRTKKLEQPIKDNHERLEMIHRLAMLGASDKEICFTMAISERTLNYYKKNNPEFFQKLQNSKAVADLKVEASLFKTATGYYIDTVKHISVSDGMQMGSHIEEVEAREYIKPSPTAQIFWLKNRQKGKWRDRHDVEVTNASDLSDEQLAEEVAEMIKREALKKKKEKVNK